MVAIPGKHRFEDTHRLHGRLNTLCIMLSSIAISMHYLIFGEARFPPGKGGDLYCKRVPAALRYPISGALEMALQDQIPKSIDIEFIDLSDTAQLKPPPETPSKTTMGIANIYTSIIGPLFVEFYEAYDEWLYRKLGNPEKWPDVWRFGRVVRNSISHGTSFSSREKKFRPHGEGYRTPMTTTTRTILELTAI
jgi:hypothetical protein